MSDLNQCSFIGRLGADVEVKSFQNGGRIANLRIAVSETWKDKNSGERKERTEWIPVSIQNEGLIGVAEKYLRKGSKVFVQGQFRTRKWQDQSGNDRYSTEVILTPFGGVLQMLDGKPDGQQGESRRGASQASGDGWGKGAGSAASGFADDLDDEIPF